ncbi:20544_t:CDS:2 [Gigaspora margarita]|uniref:ATP-dependent DNA helicase n=1 Tax=Gigaspora margarita TaxID=4874 RepID=A0ABN7UCY8_GIGMA|nr:20544_t:CDS:2 [Gigaspora margarita]
MSIGERQDFCCNSKIRSLISPLPQLPSTLQNLYINNKDIGHLSHQYDSLFLFTTLGYMGGILCLPDPHAFIINGHSYHQIHSANMEELMIVNPFVQGLYQLCDTDYPQIQLVIRQAIANIEIAACVIVHSTAIVQKRCVQIWRINEDKPDYISILNEHYEALQYPLFFPYGEIVDMFSRAEDERLQFIRKEQYRFRKGGQKEDESLSEKAEMHPEGTYLPSSHTPSFRCMRQNKICRWNYPKPIQENIVINELGHVCYRHRTKHDVNVVPYNAFLLLKLNSHINVEVASTSHVISYLYKYIYKGPDYATVNINIEENETEAIDEIKDYLNTCYLSAMETNAARALSLLEDVTENKQCFNEAGIPPQNIWLNYHELLSADYITKQNNIHEGINKTLIWIATFLEKHGIKISQIGLPQLVGYLLELMHTKTQYNNYHELVAKSVEMINQLNYEQKKLAAGRTAHSLFHIPIENNDNRSQKENIEAVDILLCELCNRNLLFGRKIFIGVGDFCQVAPVIPNAEKAATILESIKLSSIWNTFEINNL